MHMANKNHAYGLNCPHVSFLDSFVSVLPQAQAKVITSAHKELLTVLKAQINEFSLDSLLESLIIARFSSFILFLCHFGVGTVPETLLEKMPCALFDEELQFLPVVIEIYLTQKNYPVPQFQRKDMVFVEVASITFDLTVSVGVITAVAAVASVGYVSFVTNSLADPTVLSTAVGVVMIVVDQNDAVLFASQFVQLVVLGSTGSVPLVSEIRRLVAIADNEFLVGTSDLSGGSKALFGICGSIPLGLPTMTSELAVIISPGRMGMPPFCNGVCNFAPLHKTFFLSGREDINQLLLLLKCRVSGIGAGGFICKLCDVKTDVICAGGSDLVIMTCVSIFGIVFKVAPLSFSTVNKSLV
uniref:Uncharacterized protein n=1 Tax=Glossina brevipalpis TaxID=37001 RepID=A0A1A9WQA5_9MUSC